MGCLVHCNYLQLSYFYLCQSCKSRKLARTTVRIAFHLINGVRLPRFVLIKLLTFLCPISTIKESSRFFSIPRPSNSLQYVSKSSFLSPSNTLSYSNILQSSDAATRICVIHVRLLIVSIDGSSTDTPWSARNKYSPQKVKPLAHRDSWSMSCFCFRAFAILTAAY